MPNTDELMTAAQVADMIPVHVRVASPGRSDRDFHAEIARHRFLTPLLAGTVIANAAHCKALSDVCMKVAKVMSQVLSHSAVP